MTVTQQTLADRLKSEAMARRSPEQKALDGAGGLAKHKTLRDEFAISALVALATSGGSISSIAEISYRVADAMLEARKTPTEDD